MQNAPRVTAFAAANLPTVETHMREIVSAAGPGLLRTMLLYHLGWSSTTGEPERAATGKRIRPILVMAAGLAGGDVSPSAGAHWAAAAVELLHNFSLIHDDIEDRDLLRHGRATLWSVWGVPLAINAGDAMFAMAHQALLRTAEHGAKAEHSLAALNVFDTMCVALTRGQHQDIGFEQRTEISSAEYLEMIGGKTAALTEACCALGAIFGGSSAEQRIALASFGRDLGLAFQIQDDVLGVWGDPARTGKADSDLAHAKKTYPVLIAAERDAEFKRRYFSAIEAKRDEDWLRDRMEACGAREASEAAASATYQRGLAALTAAQAAAPALSLLGELARALFGRDA